MNGKHVLCLVQPCRSPGWGDRGSRHSRNIFSVHSLVISKLHLRVKRREEKTGKGVMTQQALGMEEASNGQKRTIQKHTGKGDGQAGHREKGK